MKYYFVTNENESAIIESEEAPKMYGEGGKWTSRSWSNSLEELTEKEGILPEMCRTCGKHVHTSFVPETKARLIEKNICFTCLYWEDRCEMGKQKRSIVVGHVAYTAHKTNPGDPGSCRGFGGSKFRFRRFGSEEIEECTNMWFQGPIPERYWERLPDNAEFVKSTEQYEHVPD